MTTGEAWIVAGGALLTVAIIAALLFWIREELRDRGSAARPSQDVRPDRGHNDLHV